MRAASFRLRLLAISCLLAISATLALGMSDERSDFPKAFLDGTGPGWRALGEDDFVNVNCDPDTWSWKDGVIHCTGQPVGVMRTKKPLTNFELVAQWRHLRSGGNSGIFVWAAEKSLEGIKPGSLPRGGIEVQILDHGFREQYEKRSKKKGDWFTTHGDVFAVGTSKMKPFPPTLARRPPQLPLEEPEQGRRRVEPLLRAVHQRRGPAVGQRRGGLRRERLRAAHRLPLPRIRRRARSSSAICGSASCREDRADRRYSGFRPMRFTIRIELRDLLMSMPSDDLRPYAGGDWLPPRARGLLEAAAAHARS